VSEQPAPIAALALLLTAAAAQAQTPVSCYTELVGGRCKFVAIGQQTNEDQVKRCPGHGGAEVETLASHTRFHIGYRFSRTQAVKNVVVAWSAGKTIEWRGLKTNKGFQPYATIVRLLMRDPESEKPDADGQVLAIMRFDAREAEACAMAYIDARANKDPNALARATADRLGPEFDCRSDKPTVIGEKSRWTAELMKERGR
jgi:hypothetical protein